MGCYLQKTSLNQGVKAWKEINTKVGWGKRRVNIPAEVGELTSWKKYANPLPFGQLPLIVLGMRCWEICFVW